MVTLPIYSQEGEKVGDYEIDVDALAPNINKQLLHDAVVMYQANLRQGSFKTKTRGEVAGSTHKMYRQKGTGNARAGHRRSGVRRGGGHIFAKQPRSFYYRLPRKVLKAATRMALASKLASKIKETPAVVVVDQLSLAAPRTKQMADLLKAIGASEQTALLAIESHDSNIYKSVRNIPGVQVSPVSDLNALEILRPQRLLITKAALDAARERYAAPAGGKSE